MAEKLNPFALGYAGAVLGAVGMLLLGILGNLGLYMNGIEAMKQWHLFFSLSIVGIIAGIIEAAVFCFAFLFALACLYNKFA